jgi:hypothetical protein
MIREHKSGRHDHKRILFSLLTFEVWHELFISPAHWPSVVADGRSIVRT